MNALRLQSKMQFVIVRDNTGMAQVTHKRDGGLLEDQLEALTPESAIKITGRVVDAARVKLGGLEIVPEAVEVLNLTATPLPIDEHTGMEGSATGLGDRFGHAAWRAGVVMTVSNSTGVSRPSAACLRRRW
ncbi:OB-fold nucleic acid binding protein [Streptomyces noursei ATCC 11455]|nr:OB-fold nucleic acid binding protein [Streptomyces noursei ATCC 11455]